MSGRKLAIAKRCQLLTGSYDGATRSCDCLVPDGCFLSPKERVEFINHPEVIEAFNRNRDECKQLENENA